jgi:molecular chaperone GrpE
VTDRNEPAAYASKLANEPAASARKLTNEPAASARKLTNEPDASARKLTEGTEGNVTDAEPKHQKRPATDPVKVDTTAGAMAGGVPEPEVDAQEAGSVAHALPDAEPDAAAPEGTKVEGDPLAKAAPSGVADAGPAGRGDRGDNGDKSDKGEAPAKPLGAELAALRTAVEERTRDLQRITAEYANYRKRVDRDRTLVVEQATGGVLSTLLPVLDDLDRAREHGDLTGPFAAVAEQLTTALAKFGLTPFGSPGDTFDPTRHEAVTHTTSAEVTEPTCVEVMRRGYLLGERLLRAALVAVADPE